ncbi:MAG: zinc-ribbon domain-containing protein [Ruminococcaceae bacterium]|nr:zinc-ribbon domain-containing protein [Oscillospiraceae bacterium]
MVTCPKCGKQLPDGSKFCKFCGNQVAMMPSQTAPAYSTVPQKQNNNKASANKKKSPKNIIFAIIAVILVVAIAVTGWFLWDHFGGKKDEESLNDKEKLTKILEESTTKPIVEFVYDDYDSDGTYEAYAVVGETVDEDDKHPEFYDADIYFVNNKKAQKIKENVSGQVNGKIKLEKTKYISIEVYEDGTKKGKSFIYSAEGTKFVEPDISGKYSRVRLEDGKLVADDENGKKIEVDINGNKLTIDFDPAVYEDTVLAQYRRVLGGEFNSLSDSEKNYLHDDLLFAYENGDKFYYALYDIDKNGIDELFISYEGTYSFGSNVYAAYTYGNGDVHYLEGSGYRYWLYPKSNGKLVQNYNVGAGANGATIFVIGSDGYTIEAEISLSYYYDGYDGSISYYKTINEKQESISESEYNSFRSQYGLDEYLSADSDIDFDWIELTLDDSTSNQMSIPSDAVYYNGNYYKLYDEGMTWDEAVAFCEETGGHLCTITNVNEQLHIESMMNSGTKYTYWLGGKSTDGVWSWITNEAFSYSNWATGEPNHFNGTEDCLMIYNEPNQTNGSTFGSWNDLTYDCRCYGDDYFSTDIFGFICEWEGN